MEGLGPKYRPELLDWLTGHLAGRPELRRRGAFGYPGFMAAGRMFVFVYGNGLALKLPAAVLDQLTGPAYRPFAPAGSPMRNWVLIVRDAPAEFAVDTALIDEAISHVTAEQSENRTQTGRSAP